LLLHVPLVIGVQPGQRLAHDEPHDAHVRAGVPWHDGDTLNSCGGIGKPARSTLQQICPVQSLSSLHDFGHELAHTPSQQSWPVLLQSAEVVHAFGQGSFAGLRHRPVTLRFGSTVFADVQQTSPDVVSQSLLVPQLFGQRLAGVQIGVL
jgi:hypothetical protein